MAAITTRASTVDINRLVRDLRQIHSDTGLGSMVRVGSLIIDRLYEGDASRWQWHSRQDIRFRKLAKHPKLPFQASTLSRAVRVCLLARRFPKVAQLERVGLSHLREVLRLDHREQSRLLEMADTQGWSTRRLRAEVRAVHDPVGRRDRPPPSGTSFQRCLRQWRELVEGQTLLANLDSIHHLDAGTTLELLTVVRSICQHAEALAQQLSMRFEAAEQVPDRGASEPKRE